MLREFDSAAAKREEELELQVSFQRKNPDFLLKNPDFLLKNVDYIIKKGPVSALCDPEGDG